MDSLAESLTFSASSDIFSLICEVPVVLISASNSESSAADFMKNSGKILIFSQKFTILEAVLSSTDTGTLKA